MRFWTKTKKIKKLKLSTINNHNLLSSPLNIKIINWRSVTCASVYIAVSATAITLSALNQSSSIAIHEKKVEIIPVKPFVAPDKVAQKTVNEFDAYNSCRSKWLPSYCRKFGNGKYTW
ncbi:hypothetical protein A6V39_04650 [Candidatus Mycoplasma haematobovis]|uniref:Uncharacterized protein n=1 Tax=Candidatus Mycoplasma haematobovis TaxID=432608 RepID=A0A1A9QDR7_9MOLU|nr:hypothetical protein A6V39_04650 [Candidatus Mycoplasma haematobovis]